MVDDITVRRHRRALWIRATKAPRVRGPRAKTQPDRQKPRLARNRLNEFLGRSAAVNRPSTHQHPLEGARIALFETRGAGAAQRILDRWSRSTVGFSPFAIPRPTPPVSEQPRQHASVVPPIGSRFARWFRHRVSAQLLKTRRVRIDYRDHSQGQLPDNPNPRQDPIHPSDRTRSSPKRAGIACLCSIVCQILPRSIVV